MLVTTVASSWYSFITIIIEIEKFPFIITEQLKLIPLELLKLISWINKYD